MKKKTLTILLALVCLQAAAQEKETVYLRRKVDSLETVIRNLRRTYRGSSTVSSLGSAPAGNPIQTRTSYFDSLGELDYDMTEYGREPAGAEDFMGFGHPELVGTMIETFSEAQTEIWGGILGRWFRYRDILKDYFKSNGLPEELAMVCVIESGCSPKATSRAGAKGFWQLMPQTATDMGLRVDALVDERMDIDKSTQVAVRYFKNAYAALGDWAAAVASYNWGIGNVRRAMEKYGTEIDDYYDHMPEETRTYLPSLLAALWLEENYGKTSVVPREQGGQTVARRVTYMMSFEEISTITGIDIGEIRRQNPQYLQEYVPGNDGVFYIKADSKYRNQLNRL